MYLKGTWSLVGVAIWEEFGALGGMEEALGIGRPFQFFFCFLFVAEAVSSQLPASAPASLAVRPSWALPQELCAEVAGLGVFFHTVFYHSRK